MPKRADFLEGLLELPTLSDRTLQRAAFRQSIASLAIAASVEGPSPLEGLNPHVLLRSVRVALAESLFDQLDFLAAPAAAVALYEIAAALPLGMERREVGRRAAVHLQDGSAATFVAIA